MKTLEKSQDKIEKICQALRQEAIEPAEIRAQEIIKDAEVQAEELVRQAEKRATEALEKAQKEIEQEKALFKSSLSQAARQGVETLKQEIEHKLFNKELEALIARETTDPAVIASIINAVVKGIDKQGLSGDIVAYIPKSISPQSVNALILDEVLKKLKKGSVEIGEFKGGAKVKLLDRKMMIDMSDSALEELLAQFVRKDFRNFIFSH